MFPTRLWEQQVHRQVRWLLLATKFYLSCPFLHTSPNLSFLGRVDRINLCENLWQARVSSRIVLKCKFTQFMKKTSFVWGTNIDIDPSLKMVSRFSLDGPSKFLILYVSNATVYTFHNTNINRCQCLQNASSKKFTVCIWDLLSMLDSL